MSDPAGEAPVSDQEYMQSIVLTAAEFMENRAKELAAELEAKGEKSEAGAVLAAVAIIAQNLRADIAGKPPAE